MRVAVIDGQGGGFGRSIIESIRKSGIEDIEILGLGTNALATAAMLKAGANEGATGENAIKCNAGKADVIIGSIAILMADSMLGELTSGMAQAIAASEAQKILIPLNKNRVYITRVPEEPLPHHIEDAVNKLKSIRSNKNV